MRELLAIMKALADENRLRIVRALQAANCACARLSSCLAWQTPPSRGTCRSCIRPAWWNPARMGDGATFAWLEKRHRRKPAKAAALVIKSLEHDDKARSDAKRLKQILKMDPEVLCRKQSECKC